jgi:hypothetical protein
MSFDLETDAFHQTSGAKASAPKSKRPSIGGPSSANSRETSRQPAQQISQHSAGLQPSSPRQTQALNFSSDGRVVAPLPQRISATPTTVRPEALRSAEPTIRSASNQPLNRTQSVSAHKPVSQQQTELTIIPPPVLLDHEASDWQPGETSLTATELFWWERDLANPVLRNRPGMPLSLAEALHQSLHEAPELKILHADWYIQMQETVRQDAAFDWTTFVDSVWNRDSNPVGSQLDGAAQRLRSRTSSASAGLRRLDRTGGQLELSQQIGFKESNSQFISPNNQGNSRLALQYERPLLRRAGEEYNTGSLRIAELDKDIAFDRMQAGIQDHLLETARAYWALVLARGDFLQKVTSWSRANAIAEEMQTRVEIDVTPGTLDRAKSEVSARLAQTIQSEHDVTSAQEVLLELIYASRFTEFTHYEVITTTLPPHQPGPIDVDAQTEVAMQTRSEVQQAIREIRAASIEYNLARNEVLPRLDLILSGYSAGLRPSQDVGGSMLDQFTEGEPGAGVGLEFEIPYRNRAAKAAAEQRRIAVTRLQREFETIVGEVKQDVRQQSIRRNKFAATLPQQSESLLLARRLMDYSQTRRDFLADGVRVAELYLNDLLQIQNRLQNAEFQYLQTQVSFAVADNALMRSVASLQNLANNAGPAMIPSVPIAGTSANAIPMPQLPALQPPTIQPPLMAP